MKFCIDCRHAVAHESGDIYRMQCESQNNYVPWVENDKYLVSGIEQPHIKALIGPSCRALRASARHPTMHDLPLCGPTGEWFEPKESHA